MAIYPDKKAGKLTGRWRVEVQWAGRRKRGRFSTIDDARKAEAEWTAALRSGAIDGIPREDTRTGPKTLLALLDQAAPLIWNGSGHGDLSRAKVRQLASWIGDTRLEALDTSYVDRAVSRLRAEGRSPATVNRYLSALHRVLVWGHKRGHLKVLPEFTWQDEDEGRIRWITPDEEDRLIRSLRALGFDLVADFVVAAIDTGCRRAELLGAKREHLDPGWLRLWETKSGHARSVPLTMRAQAVLEARLPWQLTEAQIRYAWDKAKTAIGLSQDDDFVLHACRHTCATRLVERGVNLRVVQQFMGHRNISTTTRYAHVNDDMLSAAVSRLEVTPMTYRGGGVEVGGKDASQSSMPHRGDLKAVQ